MLLSDGIAKLQLVLFAALKCCQAFSDRATMRLSRKGLMMSRYLGQFWSDQSGATAIEYGLIAAGISVAIIATVQALGTNLNTTFSSVSTALK